VRRLSDLHPTVSVRPARREDAAAMAAVNVASWRETYRGLMSDDVLDEPTFELRRTAFWTAALTDERYAQNRAAVAECDGELVGIAMSGPPIDRTCPAPLQLYLLYVLAGKQGLGIGATLLEAVIEPSQGASLWVADPNPPAQAFYRKHGSSPDGVVQVEDGVREIRMTRAVG
jgi:ribosomal protein S18 acetylase RimI-like enzyme